MCSLLGNCWLESEFSWLCFNGLATVKDLTDEFKSLHTVGTMKASYTFSNDHSNLRLSLNQ